MLSKYVFYMLLRQIVLSLLSYHLWMQKIGSLGIIFLFLCLTHFAVLGDTL